MSTPLRVLLVEDAEDGFLVIQGELSRHGYAPEILRVNSAERLRSALNNGPWDLVISEFALPGFSAVQALGVLAERELDVPFIVISGSVTEDVIVQAMKAGAHDYVMKGNLTRLVPAIQREMREARNRSERRAVEAVLKAKDALNRAVLDSLTAEVAVLDEAGRIATANAAWIEFARENGIAGAGDGSLVGRNYIAVCRCASSAASADRAANGIEAVLSGQLFHFSLEYPFHRRGTERWFLLHVSPLRGTGGAVISQIDITERKMAEEALRRGEARFRSVVESMAEGLLLTDLKDVVLYVNPRMTELTGYDQSEFIGRPAHELLQPQSDWSEAIERDQRRARGLAERYELTLLRKDGTPFWAEVSAVPVRDAAGKVIGTAGAVTDVTERRRTQEALKRSEERLLRAQRVGRVGSWERSIAENQLTWSPETYRIFGFEPGAFAPTKERFLESIHPSDVEIVRAAIEKTLSDGVPYSIDHRIIRSDGTERWVHEQAEIVPDENGRPAQLMGTVQDITDRRVLEEQVRQSQKMEAVGQLAGGIAHDFNNILTVIKGYTELIAWNSSVDDETREQINQIAASAERASRLTRQLLAFSRLQPLQLNTLDLNQLLASLVSMINRLMGEHVKVKLQLSPELPLVMADVNMIEQVLVNLAVNARDAMPRGGELVLSTTYRELDARFCQSQTEAKPGRFACIMVRDTGSGMDSKTMSRIFEPFYTTKEVGKGTGLGLSTVYGIVKQHHGWIEVSSALSKGTEFTVFLPAIEGAPQPCDAPVTAVVPPRGFETILLVEDELPLRTLARTILRNQGYRVLEAATGPQALTVWRNHSTEIQLLITDIVMPDGMTGRELALSLLAEQPDLKVLYTSGYSVDFVEGDLYLHEGLNFIPKPYSGSLLTHTVRKCLDTAQPPE